jgi:hypothetical protein
MNSNTSMILFIVGLLMTLGGVGGMEDPAKEAYFIEQIIVSGVGLLVMWIGTLGLNSNQNN